MPLPIADYIEPRAAFTALLNAECPAHILLFSGASGSGKTTLLNACLAEAAARHFPTIPIQLRGSVTPIPEIFSRLGDRQGWETMPTFIATLRAIPKVEIDANRLIGINNQINVALNAPPEDRDQRRAALTDAWFADLRAQQHPYLIAIDTYEAAIPEVQNWLAGPFLARSAVTPALRVLIAGQTVPDPQNIEWGFCCAHHPLYGVPEAQHWLPVITAMGRYIPVEHPEAWLAGVCHAFNGAPKDIMQIIERLPRLEATA